MENCKRLLTSLAQSLRFVSNSADNCTITKWPKRLEPLTEEQEKIRDDFMQFWLQLLPKKYGILEEFNHGYPVRHSPTSFFRTLEVGAGSGEHIAYEQLTEEQRRNYIALELRPGLCQTIAQCHPGILVIRGDCQERLDYPDGYFDRILAIHVLEHLPNLPNAIKEIHRVIRKDKGILSVVIPCEGGFIYWVARRISAQRIFEKRYGQSYRWFIEHEHINRPHEIMSELGPYFLCNHRGFFPFYLPYVFCNLAIGLTLTPKEIV